MVVQFAQLIGTHFGTHWGLSFLSGVSKIDRARQQQFVCRARRSIKIFRFYGLSEESLLSEASVEVAVG